MWLCGPRPSRLSPRSSSRPPSPAAAARRGAGATGTGARLVNDLAAPIRVRLCADTICDTLATSSRLLEPGERWEVAVSSEGVPNVFAVISKAGFRLGCLPLVSPAPRSRIDVDVSEHVPCARRIDVRRFWPARWADTSD